MRSSVPFRIAVTTPSAEMRGAVYLGDPAFCSAARANILTGTSVEQYNQKCTFIKIHKLVDELSKMYLTIVLILIILIK
jgi:hypothetical protein